MKNINNFNWPCRPEVLSQCRRAAFVGKPTMTFTSECAVDAIDDRVKVR